MLKYLTAKNVGHPKGLVSKDLFGIPVTYNESIFRLRYSGEITLEPGEAFLKVESGHIYIYGVTLNLEVIASYKPEIRNQLRLRLQRISILSRDQRAVVQSLLG